MALIKIADLKNNLSRHLQLVKQGGQITVLERDKPVARIIPFNPADAGPGDARDAATVERVAALVREGVLTPGDPAAAARWLDAHPAAQLPAGGPGAVATLIAMRRESTR
jgi:antitoxin (DNA-binding transcriptional repressor) of toxin-antitoxin stability system